MSETEVSIRNLELFKFPISNPKYKIKPLELAHEDNLSKNERLSLEKKYHDLFLAKFDWRQLVTYVPNKNIPVYNWFKYKEGFSRELVIQIVKEFALKKGDIIFDPFAGCGTTLLASKELGLHGLGIDVLPTAVFITKVKLVEWGDTELLMQSVKKLISIPYHKPESKFPDDVKIINLAFSHDIQQEILFFKDEIEKFKQPVRDFLMLGLLSILESVSSTSKDGQFLRLVKKSIPSVRIILNSVLLEMVSDLKKMKILGLLKPSPKKMLVKEGDARDLCIPKKYWGKVSAVITSPPYLNRYDYSRTYALELCLLSAKTHIDMVNIRHSLLRSHIESRECSASQITLPVLDEILREIKSKPLNNNRLPVMIKGYFEDMNLVIKQLATYLKLNGRVALVVANAQFAGENVPTDLILCELAERYGLTTESIWITRYKGNSSQQMAIYGRRPVRETIVFWRKR
jgi:hypothetical protein